MITLLIIFVGVYIWRDVKDSHRVYFASFFGASAITSEILTNLSLINMLATTIGDHIL